MILEGAYLRAEVLATQGAAVLVTAAAGAAAEGLV